MRVNNMKSRVNFRPKIIWVWLTSPWFHIGYWSLYIGSELLVRVINGLQLHDPLLISLNILFLVTFFYTTSFWAFPKLIDNSIWEGLVNISLLFLLHCSIKFFVGVILNYSIDMKAIIRDEALMAIHFIPLAGGYWYARLSLRIEIEKDLYLKEKTKAEAKYSQSLLSPHFLFNYLMGIQEDILINTHNYIRCIPKLSKLIQYGLRHVDTQSTWHKEKKALESFIDLNMIRFGDQFFYEFFDNVPVKAKKKMPMPALITINIVDNVFKYAAYKNPNHPVQISLKLCQLDGNTGIEFSLNNLITHRHIPESLGLGLSNCKKILETEFGPMVLFNYGVEDDCFNLLLRINYGSLSV